MLIKLPGFLFEPFNATEGAERCRAPETAKLVLITRAIELRNPFGVSANGKPAVLCVEDDDASFFLIELAFKQIERTVRLHRVREGAEALAFLSRAGDYTAAPKPALILLNLNMPKMNGFEVLKAMRDRGINDIPTVVFSSSDLSSDKAQCLALGARAFITKPSEFDAFATALTEACGLMC